MLLGAQARQEWLAAKRANLKLPDDESAPSWLAHAHPVTSLLLISSLVSAQLALKKGLLIMCLSGQLEISSKHLE